ncbi:MAG: hypothetical protein CMN16_07530 [Roseovarius sp.]|nr:hypothetical protein [Roseovarius sp.]
MRPGVEGTRTFPGTAPAHEIELPGSNHLGTELLCSFLEFVRAFTLSATPAAGLFHHAGKDCSFLQPFLSSFEVILGQGWLFLFVRRLLSLFSQIFALILGFSFILNLCFWLLFAFIISGRGAFLLQLFEQLFDGFVVHLFQLGECEGRLVADAEENYRIIRFGPLEFKIE